MIRCMGSETLSYDTQFAPTDLALSMIVYHRDCSETIYI